MAVEKRSILAWSFCLTAFLVFLTACLLPAVDFGPSPFGSGRPDGVFSGSYALGWGWANILRAMAPDLNWHERASALAWLANPIGLTGMIMLGFRLSAPATVMGGTACALGILYLASPYGDPLVGSYVWVGSLALLFLGSATVMVLGWFTRSWTF